MQVRHAVVAEVGVVFRAVEIGIDLGVVALLLQDREVVQHLRLVLGSAAEQMLVVELDEAVGVAGLEEAGAVLRALGHGAHEFAHVEIAVDEQRFSSFEPLAVHQVLAAQHLLVHGADDGALVAVGGVAPVRFVLAVGKPLDAQGGRLHERHEGRAGRQGERREHTPPARP